MAIPIPNDIRELNIVHLKIFLRIDEDLDDIAEDMFLEMILASAKSFILSYLNVPDFEYLEQKHNSAGEVVGVKEIPKELSMACLMLCLHWYENRSMVTQRYETGKEIPFTFSALLSPHRRYITGCED